MEIVQSHKTPLTRQVQEGQLIADFEGDFIIIINRKGEWGENLPTKLIIEDSGETPESGKPK